MFFKKYSECIQKNSEWPLLDEKNNLVVVKALHTSDVLIPNEFPEFLPCYCDAGHPYLFALRNTTKQCRCEGPTYLKVLARSDVAVNSLLVRSVALYCINGHKTKAIGADSSVAQTSVPCSNEKHQ